MKLTQIVTAAIISLALYSNSANAQTGTITAWNFNNDTVAVNNNPATSTGSGSLTPLNMTVYNTPGIGTNSSDVVLGAAADTGTNGNADLTNTWRVRAKGSGNGWSTLAPIGTQGAEFSSSTAGHTTGAIQISFDWYVTNQAEANMEVLYTTDGTTWNNLALTLGATGTETNLAELTGSSTDTLTTSGSYVQASGGQDWFTGLTATITDPSALNDSNFAFEVVNASTGTDNIGASGGAYNNTSGNWRFDNVIISDVAAAPEPASWSLGIIAILALAGYSLRRKSRA
jgi:hypothetical protein